MERVVLLQRLRPARRTRGFFTRVGIRPNEGTMDVGLSIWLPGGDLAEYRHQSSATRCSSAPFEVGGVRYELLEAMRRWRLVADVDGHRAALPSGRRGPVGPSRSGSTSRSRRSRPAVGRTAAPAPGRGPRSRARRRRRPARGTSSRPGRWTGYARRRRCDPPVERRAGQPRPVLGPAPMGRALDVAMVLDQRRATGCTSAASASAPTPGDLHRGWVSEDGHVASIARWGLTHRARGRPADPAGHPPRGARQGGPHLRS